MVDEPRPAKVDREGRPLVFISYRRGDTKSKIASLSHALALQFGPDSVFVDTDKIRVGDQWKSDIQNALKRASVLIVAIGDRWLSVTDEFHRRRIDNNADWVRQEIKFALENGKPILPVRFDNEPPLKEEALPDDIARLAGLQSIELRETDWQEDVDRLLRCLTEFGFERPVRSVIYPIPVISEPVATEAEIREFLQRYPDWTVQYRPHPAEPRSQRRGIGTTLTFRSFRDAIHFMSTASWGIDERHHHPEWENIWKSVIIWITQFDIGGDITLRNIELAEYLMSAYEPYSKVAH